MSPQVAFLLSKACECLDKSNLEGANLYLKQALSIESNNSEATRLSGVLYALRGEHTHALRIFERVIKLTPRSSIAHSNKGNVLKELNKLDEAISSYNKAISLKPDYAEVYSNKGNALQALGRFEEAIECHEKAIELQPNYYQAENNKGNALYELQRFLDAIKCFDKAISMNINYFAAYKNKGSTLHKLNRFVEAIKCFDQAIFLYPKCHETQNKKGNALSELKQFTEAIECYDLAIALNPNYYEAFNNKAIAFRQIKDYKSAILCLNQSLSIQSNQCHAWTVKGLIFFELLKTAEARKCFEKAIFINPDSSEAKLNFAVLELSQLNFREGWRHYEARWSMTDNNSPKLKTTKPAWAGSESQNKVFIWSEQGIGDQILYSSMLHELNKFPQKNLISLDKKLIPIFKRSFPSYEFVNKDDEVSEDRYSHQIPIGSLGQIFRNSLEDFQRAHYPYIADDTARTQLIKSRIEFSSKKTCGISWGSVNKKLGDDKSIPIQDLYPILKMSNIEFINLQYGEVINTLFQVSKEIEKKIINLDDVDLYEDVDGALSIIAACDIVVTSSNSTAHLAGALGKETLLLVPYSAGQFWYWHSIDGKSIWYPSVTVYEQDTQGDWSTPINGAKQYLERRFG
jgi:tetratricopeptide (TPR) repeat protein